jgi:hypothetical protein
LDDGRESRQTPLPPQCLGIMDDHFTAQDPFALAVQFDGQGPKWSLKMVRL